MPEDIVIRVLLLPLALLYGLGVSFRNLMYRMGVLKSVRFDIPVISVGNLAIGGTGKSPHIEYMVRWLDQYIDVAVLSRGYGRKTVGYRPVYHIDKATDVGDEPLQMKRKFQQIPFAVSESRALGVPELVKNNPTTQCVLLDDAFQHLAVTPGLHVMLTEYKRPFFKDWLLPSGRLREWRAAYRRADVIIVTKCPDNLTETQRSQFIEDIAPYPRQKIFFSQYQYGRPYDLLRHDVKRALDADTDVLLLSAIANTDYLLSYLKKEVRSVRTIEHEDHHFFDEGDMSDLLKKFDGLNSAKKIILTTEKDATRLEAFSEFLWKHQLPVFVLPIEVAFLHQDEDRFKEAVKRFLEGFKA
jgi:tetraacyldisaccharide 4'-kinase